MTLHRLMTDLSPSSTTHLLEHGQVLRSLPFQCLIGLPKGGAQISFQVLDLRFLVADDRQLVLNKISHSHARVRMPDLYD